MNPAGLSTVGHLSGRGARDRGRLADICALVPGILAAEAGRWPRNGARPGIARAHLTASGRAVVMLAPPGESPWAVIKLPLTAEAHRGLEREAHVLAALHADDRLGGWRRLVPRPLAEGTVLGQPYRIESVVGGSETGARAGDEATRGVLSDAAAAIHVLHRNTASVARCDTRLAERWIDGRIDDLARRGERSHRRRASRLDELRAELHGAVSGRAFSTSWIHGDYWLGNVLSSPTAPAIGGIVDWDAAGSEELAIHDVMHLLFYTRRLRTGRELGELVRGQLRRDRWSPRERHLLERYGAWCHDGSLSERHAVLMYWLRHAAFHTRQQVHPPTYRHRIWEMRNVQPVLAAL
jgi:aminoglycoside phosphotransferase (APT) family kinase protein